jgi:hypothetical protein
MRLDGGVSYRRVGSEAVRHLREPHATGQAASSNRANVRLLDAILATGWGYVLFWSIFGVAVAALFLGAYLLFRRREWF